MSCRQHGASCPGPWNRLSSRKRAAIKALVFAEKGTACYVPGCPAPATTVDHITPDSVAHDHSVANLRPACKPHNSSRGNRASGDGSYGARTVVVTGPPASGKSTHVERNALPADVVIDLDALARALMPVQPTASHTYPDHVRHVAIGARAEAIRRATRLREPVTVWLIHSIPTTEQLAEYRAAGYTIETIDPGEEIVRARVLEQRPAKVQAVVDRWYATRRQATPSRAW